MRTSSEPAWAELDALLRGAGGVHGVRVGHGLDDDGRASADEDMANADRVRSFAN